MKKALLLLIFLTCLFSVYVMPFAACALSAPHVKFLGDVWLFSLEGEKLFLLPDTYYAKIDNIDETYYYITFNSVAGKVLKASVTSLGYHAKATGTMLDLKISDSYAEFDAINLKSEPDTSARNVVSMPLRESFIFLGKYPTDNELWYYVAYNQYYGYIKASRTNTPKITFDTFVPLPYTEDPQPEEQTPGKSVLEGLGDEDATLRIVIIIGLAIPAILIIFLIFKPSKLGNARY